jgi:hypothetical protein
MQIDESDEQNEKAHFSIRESLQPDSNLTLESPVHPLKHPSQRSSTDNGMQSTPVLFLQEIQESGMSTTSQTILHGTRV